MKINQKLMGFAAGTKVLMADGSERAIEKIKTGDVVLSFNQLDAFGKLEPKRVVNTFKRLDKNPLQVRLHDNETELVVASGQLFINPGSDWKDAVNINEIIDSEGNVHKFDVSQITRGKYQIHDIIVEDNHSLIANGVRVHNMLYTVGDVIAGRNLAYVEDNPGAVRDNGDDSRHSDNYNWGSNKKKKRSKNKKSYTPPPKVDGVQAAQKYIREIDDLVDTLEVLVANTSVTNLISLRATIQYSIDTISNLCQNLIASLVTGTMSAYDKSESLIIVSDMLSSAVSMRKPFEETNITANGKAIAVGQLVLIELLIDRLTKKLATYTTPPAEDDETKSSKKKRNTSSRQMNGSYNQPAQREGATGRSGDFGSDRRSPGGPTNRERAAAARQTNSTSSRGTTTNTQTRSTNGTGAITRSNAADPNSRGNIRGGGLQSGTTFSSTAPRAGERPSSFSKTSAPTGTPKI